MGEKSSFILVEQKVLPEIFDRVLQAKKLIAQEKAKNSTEACKLVDISRSAFYKYRDSVFPYKPADDRIVTLELKLTDEKGVLSAVLTKLYECGANILTVNQNIPSDLIANVTISVRLEQGNVDEETLLEKMYAISGVVKVKTI